MDTEDAKDNPCHVLTKYEDDCKKGQRCWPSLLVPQLKENEPMDGKITPDEFDEELGKLKNWRELVENVREKPMMRTM